MQKSELENQKLFNNVEGLVLSKEELRKVNGGLGLQMGVAVCLYASALYTVVKILQHHAQK